MLSGEDKHIPSDEEPVPEDTTNMVGIPMLSILHCARSWTHFTCAINQCE